MQEDLEELIKRIIRELDENSLDDRIDNYTDYKSKYIILKPTVKVDVELTCGKVIKIDVSDYFKEVIR